MQTGETNACWDMLVVEGSLGGRACFHSMTLTKLGNTLQGSKPQGHGCNEMASL